MFLGVIVLLGSVLISGCTDDDTVSPGDSDPPAETGDTGTPPPPPPGPLCGVEAGIVEAAALTVTFGAPQDALAATLAAPGDVHGDGTADLLVGAVGSDVSATDAGALFLVPGGIPAQLDYVPSASDSLYGESAGDGFGYPSRAGDVDGDGLADAVVGASTEDTGGSAAGAAYLLFGDPGGLGVRPRIKLVGEQPMQGIGRAVTLGDLDGDGGDDLLFLSEGTTGGPAYVVRSSALLGAASPAPVGDVAHLTFLQETPTDGLARGTAGDLDGDGVTDLVLAPRFRDGQAGAIDVFFGVNALSGTVSLADETWDVRLRGSPLSYTGHSLTIPGDVDLDGRDDLLVGAPHENTVDELRGAAFLVTAVAPGDHAMAEVAAVRIDGAARGDRMGYDVDAGDLDGDGALDLLLGAKFDDAPMVDVGSVYLVRGGAIPPGTYQPGIDALLEVESAHGEDAGDQLGVVVYVGDSDGDGLGDFAAGARFHDQERGAGYLVRCGL